MVTLNEIVYEIVSVLDQDANSEVINRVTNLVHSYRAKMYRQRHDVGEHSSMWLENLRVPVKPVKGHSICDEIGCTVLKSKKQVEPPIVTKAKPNHYFVGTADYLSAYTHIDYNYLKSALQHKWMGSYVKYYSYFEGYIYVYNVDVVDTIGVRDPFANPFKATECCDDAKTIDSYYPLPVDLIEPIKKLILTNDLGVILNQDDELSNVASKQ